MKKSWEIVTVFYFPIKIFTSKTLKPEGTNTT